MSIMQNEFDFASVSASFGLKWPSRVIKTLRENFVQLNLSGADEIIKGEGIAVPNDDIDLTKTFNKGKCELLMK